MAQVSLDLSTITTRGSSIILAKHVRITPSYYSKQALILFTGRVPQNTSLFDYGLTNSNYPTQNPTNFSANYTTNTQEPYYTNANSACALLTDGGNLAERCRSYVDFLPYYTSCVFDVVATRDPTMAESSIIAYSTICRQFLDPSSGGMQNTIFSLSFCFFLIEKD